MKRFGLAGKVRVFLLVGALLLTAILFLVLRSPSFRKSSDTVTVARVIDGDTVVLEQGRRVRYLGINAPEAQDPHGKEATVANDLLVGGRNVRLEYDGSRRDTYNRLLAYVFVDEMFVNETLLRQGRVHLSYPAPGRYRDRLCEAQEKARSEGVGIWAQNVAWESVAITAVHANAKGDDRRNLNDEFVVLENVGRHPLDFNGWTISDAANNRYLFSNFTLPSKGAVMLRTGLGVPSARELFWGSRRPVWNNGGDAIFIRDSQGLLVLSHIYGDGPCHGNP